MDNSNIWIEYVTMSVHVYIFDSRYPLIFFFFLSLLNIHSTIIDFIANCQQYNIIQTLRKQVESCFLFLRECITNWKFAWKTTLTTLKLKNSSAES